MILTLPKPYVKDLGSSGESRGGSSPPSRIGFFGRDKEPESNRKSSIAMRVRHGR